MQFPDEYLTTITKEDLRLMPLFAQWLSEEVTHVTDGITDRSSYHANYKMSEKGEPYIDAHVADMDLDYDGANSYLICIECDAAPDVENEDALVFNPSDLTEIYEHWVREHQADCHTAHLDKISHKLIVDGVDGFVRHLNIISKINLNLADMKEIIDSAFLEVLTDISSIDREMKEKKSE